MILQEKFIAESAMYMRQKEEISLNICKGHIKDD